MSGFTCNTILNTKTKNICWFIAHLLASSFHQNHGHSKWRKSQHVRFHLEWNRRSNRPAFFHHHNLSLCTTIDSHCLLSVQFVDNKNFPVLSFAVCKRLGIHWFVWASSWTSTCATGAVSFNDKMLHHVKAGIAEGRRVGRHRAKVSSKASFLHDGGAVFRIAFPNSVIAAGSTRGSVRSEDDLVDGCWRRKALKCDVVQVEDIATEWTGQSWNGHGCLDDLVAGAEIVDQDFQSPVACVSESVCPVHHGNAGKLWCEIELWKLRIPDQLTFAENFHT